MNCFTHAFPFLGDPYFVVGSCLPDWLSACDRKCRVRSRTAVDFVDHADPNVAKLAKGIMQHHHDDGWFHKTPVFNELILNFAVELRDLFGKERSMRPSLIGHILVEMYLDAYLHERNPGKLDDYYRQVAEVQPQMVEDAVNLFATKKTDMLTVAIKRFSKERFLYDYTTDEGTFYRINRVMKRVKLDEAPDEMLDWMPEARNRVYDSANDLLAEYAIEV